MECINQRKRTALLFACSLLSLACLAQQRNMAEALSIANDFCKSYLSTDLKLGAYIKTSSELSRGNRLSTTKEAYYIFNAQDRGFVIVSGDERMPNVLAYSDNSNFACEEIPPATRYWLDCFEEMYLRLKNASYFSHAQDSLSMTTADVQPLLNNTQWDQTHPYNKFCPSHSNQKCLTGCVATAMAQVLRYHRYPEHGKGYSNYYTSTNRIHIARDLTKDYYNWDSMLDRYSNTGNYTESSADAVAVLMASCGAAVKMDYGISSQGGSGAYQSDLLSAFVENFGYDPDAAVLSRSFFTTKEWHELLIKELEEGRPVNYGGHSTRDGGHSFVLDGFRKSITNTYPDYHVNWGWNGNCDGYYQIADLLPKENGQNAAMDGFNSSQQMTIGIQPNDGIDQRNIVLATEKLHVSKSVTTVGGSVQVYTASLCNFSYQKYSGNFSVVLTDEKGVEHVCPVDTKARSLSSLQMLRNLSCDLMLPVSIPEGIYKVSLRAIGNDQSAISVYSSSYPQLTISTNGDTPEQPSSISSKLGCSDVELLDTKDNEYEIRINIYELQNLEESPFIGDLRMILADGYGRALFAFGDSLQPGELGMYDVQPEPFMLKGVLSEGISDGLYRLYIGARPINSSEFRYVSFYDLTQPYIEPYNLFFDLRVENGEVIVDGHQYKLQPVSIHVINSNFKSPKTSVAIDGVRYSQKPISPGIFIENKKKYIKSR